MSGKQKSSSRKRMKPTVVSTASPIRMVVRRGAFQRFKDLKQKTAHLDVEVVWDRREAERRQERCLSDSERRAEERRRTPPFTWDVADFVVVTPKSKAVRKTRKRAAK